MSEFSGYMSNKIIDHMLRAQAYTPLTVYVALFTASTGLESNNPTDEVSGNAYARQTTGLSASNGGTASNTTDITFPAATPGTWGTVSHLALVDHVSATNWGTGVNVLMWSQLDTPKSIDAGDTFKINATYLTVTID